ncbi:MAG: PrsW family intramembrane metalloprotease [Patescibacteria group bacterium]
MPPTLYYGTLVTVGVLPSILWLSYYLRKDCHPEPKAMVVKTFLMGIIVSPIAIILQLVFVRFLEYLTGSPATTDGPSFYLWASLVEEVIKLYAVQMIALRTADFDEPIDAMIYMVIAGLGFAAMENILVMVRVAPDGLNGTISIWLLRFVGATLLHALSSAIVGYFLALSWFYDRHRSKLLIFGVLLATLFHFAFNMFLSISSYKLLSLIYATALLGVMALFVSVLFDKIRERRQKRIVQLT